MVRLRKVNTVVSKTALSNTPRWSGKLNESRECNMYYAYGDNIEPRGEVVADWVYFERQQ